MHSALLSPPSTGLVLVEFDQSKFHLIKDAACTGIIATVTLDVDGVTDSPEARILGVP